MTDRRAFEDKSASSQAPRSLTNLLTATEELKVAVQRKQTSQLKPLWEEAERCWKAAQLDNLYVFSRQGDQEQCVAFANALNACNEAMANATVLLQR